MVDSNDRAVMGKVMMNEVQTYSAEEEEALSSTEKMFSANSIFFKPMEWPDIKMSVLKGKGKGKEKVYKVVMVVDAPIAECAAYEYLKMSRIKSQGEQKFQLKVKNIFF